MILEIYFEGVGFMKKFICSILLVMVVFAGFLPNISNAAEQEVTDTSNTKIVIEKFKWGKYYEIPDMPYEMAINSYKKGILDVKVRDNIEGTTRLKILPARNFVYIYEKDINQFGGWRCVEKTMYSDDSFIAEIVAMSLSILKEAGIVKE